MKLNRFLNQHCLPSAFPVLTSHVCRALSSRVAVSYTVLNIQQTAVAYPRLSTQSEVIETTAK